MAYNKIENVNFEEVLRAAERIKPYLQPTPLEPAPLILGKNTFLKLENANLTHSFKIRGALNAVSAIKETLTGKGVIACSSGNFANACAYATHLMGIKAKILMPKHTPLKKVNGVKRWGAEAILFGDNYNETELEARRLEKEEKNTFFITI